jgi:hypothetical protein
MKDVGRDVVYNDRESHETKIDVLKEQILAVFAKYESEQLDPDCRTINNLEEALVNTLLKDSGKVIVDFKLHEEHRWNSSELGCVDHVLNEYYIPLYDEFNGQKFSTVGRIAKLIEKIRDEA